MDRRTFLQTGAALAVAPLLPRAADYKISLAAYSMRKYLSGKDATMDLSGFLDKCAAWKVDGAELTEYYFKKPVKAEEVAALKKKAADLGLAITGTPVGNTFTLPPGEARDKEVAKMKAWIDVSGDLGSPSIRIFAGGTPKGVEESTARGWVRECVQACLEKAAERKVILALENHGGVVATADGMLEIAKGIDSPWFGFNMDTGNFHTEDPYAELEKIAPRAVTCQVKVEMSAKGKKKEAADVPRLVAMMRKHAFKGFITLEYEAAEEPLEAIPKWLDVLRKAIG
ncbi:MAG TPA: sugar phosphate isomerase/epimerase family protein [Planctomycetota bacterium]